MALADLIAFVAAAVPLVTSPGPATLSMAATAAAFERRVAWTYWFGLLLGGVMVLSIVTSGVIAAVKTVPYAAQILSVFAAVYIVYLAWRIASAPPLNEARAGRRAPGVAAGIILNLTNVKAFAVMGSLTAGFELIPQRTIASAVMEAGVILVLLALSNIGWLFAGTALQRAFHDPKLSRLINICFAIALVASVALAALL